MRSWNLLRIAGIFLFVWFVVLKIVSRVAGRFGTATPCPASLEWLVDNPLRLWYMRPVLSWVDIQAGETVLELGPGPGVFTLRAAQLTGSEGLVIALDVQPAMITTLGRRLEQSGTKNVLPCVADAHSLPLENVTADRAFLISVLPEIPDPIQAVAQLHRVLKPDGILSVTAEFTDPDYQFLFETRRLIEPVGFTMTSYHGNLWRYTVNFRKVVL